MSEDLSFSKFDRNFQISVLKYMMEKPSFNIKCEQHLQADYFMNDVLEWFYTNITRYFKKYKVLPNRTTLGNDIKFKFNEEDREPYIKILDDIYNIETDNFQYITENLTEFIKKCFLVDSVHKIAELHRTQQAEESFKVLAERGPIINQLDFNEDDAFNPDCLNQLIEEARNVTENKIKFGIPPIDKVTGGGMAKGTVTTFIGAYNAGKSMTLMNVAFEAAKQKSKVLYFYCEGTEQEMVLRLVSRITKIPYNSCLCSSAHILSPNDVKKIEVAKEIIRKFFIVKKMKKVGTAIEDLYSYAKMKKVEFNYDLMIIDYGQILQARDFDLKNAGSYDKQGYIWNYMEQMADELDCAIATAAQFNRDGVKQSKKNNQIVKSVEIGESMNINKKSAILITINPFSDKTMCLYLDKQRNGETNIVVKCNTDWANCTVYDENLGFRTMTVQEAEEGIITPTTAQNKQSNLYNNGMKTLN